MKENMRTVIIGGSSGIGLAAAKAILSEGGSVILAGRSLDRLKAARNGLGAERVDVFSVDVGERSQVAALFAHAGRIDHVVVTAASLAYGPVGSLSESDFMKGVRSKLLGSFFIAQEGATRIEPGGSLTFTTGIAARRPMRGGSVAAMVNAGLEGLVRALAVEFSPLRVNAVSPGWTDTPIWDGMAAITPEKKQELFSQMGSKLLTGRIGKADDIAEAILYLMRNRFTTGTVLNVDGGHQLV